MTDDAHEEEVSQDIKYDMTGGWLFRLRIFGGSEKAEWEEKLSPIKAKDGTPDGVLVGAQWDMNQATQDPPKEFEKGVKYRPIFFACAGARFYCVRQQKNIVRGRHLVRACSEHGPMI